MDSDSSNDDDLEFVELLTAHQSALRCYVASLMPGDSCACDVAQQANATIWKKRDQFALGTNFKAWIFSIARYEVLNYRKKEARDSRLVFSGELEEIFAGELPYHANDFDLRQSALRLCLEGLKRSERELIFHRYFEDTTLREFAGKTGRSAAGLKVTLHRIRNKLQTCIESRIKILETSAS